MAVQKRRQSKARTASRRAMWMASKKPPAVSVCPECGEPKLPHHVCLECGKYRGEVVLEVHEETETEA